MKLLITGSAGFIGFHVAKKLLAKGYDVLGIDNLNDYYEIHHKERRNNVLKKFENFRFEKCDIANKSQLEKHWLQFEPEIVLHLAAQAGVRYSIENPDAYVHSNLVGFNNVIELVRHRKPQNFVYASSSSVYGEVRELPFKETTTLMQPESFYAATKLSNELVANTYRKLYGIPATGLRFFTVYGTHYRPDMALYKFSRLMASGKKIPVYDNGELIRDFTYIDDIVEGVSASLEFDSHGKIYNLGRGQPIQVSSMIKHLEAELGINADIEYLPMHPGDVTRTLADISLAREDLGYSPKTEFSDGVKVFCRWFKETEMQ